MAQLVGRLIWVQDAGSSNLPTRTKEPGTAFAVAGSFCLMGDSNSQMQQSGGLLLVTGWTVTTPYISHSEMATILPTRTKEPGAALAAAGSFFVMGDSKDQMQQSGGLLLVTGWTVTTPYISLGEMATNLPTRTISARWF